MSPYWRQMDISIFVIDPLNLNVFPISWIASDLTDFRIYEINRLTNLLGIQIGRAMWPLTPMKRKIHLVILLKEI